MIVAAHQTMLAPRGAPLPYDAEVEYLESTGTQYIDTGIVPLIPDDLTYEAGVSWPDVTIRKIMGRQGAFYFGCVSGGFQASLGGSNVVPGVSLSPNTKYDISTRFVPTGVTLSAPCYWSVGAVSGTAIGNYNHQPSSSSPIWIFWANDASSLRGAATIYYFRIIRSGTVLRDFVPVRVGSTGCLFDRVTGQFFYNAGTGNFTVGPDK